jgi:hypothetical protein
LDVVFICIYRRYLLLGLGFLSLIGEPTGGTYCRIAGLQTPYNGIAILEFQDFEQILSRAGKDGLTTTRMQPYSVAMGRLAKAASDRPGLIT